MSLIYNATFDKNTRKLSFEDRAGNEIYSFTVPEREKDDLTKPLTFKATQDGSSVTLKKKGSPTGDFQTSTDGGNTWADYTLNTAITLNIGDEVSFRAKANRTSEQSIDNYFQFVMDGKIKAWHNVMSLYRTNDFATYNTVVSYAFRSLFSGCTSLTKAPELPATTLADYCYREMFNGCTSLTKAPELPATKLANNCYSSMFYGCQSLTKAPELPATTITYNCYGFMFSGCTSLTKAPVLPATTLDYECYQYMFKDCTSLTKAPVLPATTLTGYCYFCMFSGCTSLTKAPVLPATTLTGYCYGFMFSGCKSLTEAPELPATTLTGYCYQAMFKGCTSLTKAPELPATTLANYCYAGMFYGCGSLNEVRCKIPSTIRTEDIPTYTGDGSSATRYPWLEGVASTGTFYTNADAHWPSGVSGIPTGWTRVPSVDDITKPLTFKATQDGSSVTLTKQGTPSGDFQTSRDGGNTWTDYTLDTAIALNTGDEVSFRAKANRTSAQSYDDYFQFVMTGKIEAWHNVMSMLRTNDFATYNTVVDCAFRNLFQNCTSLTKAPALPATTLASDCFEYMFYGCQSLTKAPELPATTLASGCYSSMFRGCTSLTKAPELPATTLAQWCYYYMFCGCTSLTEAPELPATTLADECYDGMFWLCGSLNEVRCKISSTISSSDIPKYAYNWLEGVASTGTFYTNAGAHWPSGVSGIPAGWTRTNT